MTTTFEFFAQYENGSARGFKASAQMGVADVWTLAKSIGSGSPVASIEVLLPSGLWKIIPTPEQEAARQEDAEQERTHYQVLAAQGVEF